MEKAASSRAISLGKGCSHCEEPLGEIRADDILPYFTIAIVGHIVVPMILLVERHAPPPLWLNLAVWPPLTLMLTLLLLPKVKGAVVGLMWSLRIRGDEYQ